MSQVSHSIHSAQLSGHNKVFQPRKSDWEKSLTHLRVTVEDTTSEVCVAPSLFGRLEFLWIPCLLLRWWMRADKISGEIQVHFLVWKFTDMAWNVSNVTCFTCYNFIGHLIIWIGRKGVNGHAFKTLLVSKNMCPTLNDI